jgi:hypothetical protein
MGATCPSQVEKTGFSLNDDGPVNSPAFAIKFLKNRLFLQDCCVLPRRPAPGLASPRKNGAPPERRSRISVSRRQE